MKRPILVAAAAFALVLGTPGKASAWGAYHVGYTHVGYGGVQHYGATEVRGPYGAYSGAHYGAYGAYGGVHTGYGTAVGYGGVGYPAYPTYAPAYSGGYAVGGYHYGTVGYGAGVYRRW